MPELRGDVDTQVEGGEEVVAATMSYTQSESELKSTPVHEEAMSERQTRDAVERVEPGSSRPPSPPETRSPTPRVTVMPCPTRLTPFVPPVNYGAVEKRTIFRSGFPQDRNVDFLARLGLNSMITLVEEEMKPEVAKFIDLYGVNHVCVPIKANKDGEIRASLDSICEAVLYLMNPINHPVYIHCNRGKHRTGCVIACLRKCQQWPIEEILAEYDTYAGEKARPEDKMLIKAFDPAEVYKYAKNENMLSNWPAIMRKDSVLTNDEPVDVSDLASFLPAHDTALIPTESDSDSEMSDSDDGLEIAQRVLRLSRQMDQAERESRASDVDMIEADTLEQPGEDAMEVEPVDVIDPQLMAQDQSNAEGENSEAARYDWDAVSSTHESDDTAYTSSTSPPLAVSPVRARAAA